jgi:hypothetical protein
MRFIFAVAILISVWAQQVVAESFKLSLLIHNVGTAPQARARVFLYTQNDNQIGGFELIAELGDDDKNSYGQYELRRENLRFSGNVHRGLLYADIVDVNGSLLRRVPLTYFDEKGITDLRWLKLKLRADNSLDLQFSSNYPADLTERGLFTDENSDFLLFALRTLVTKGYVTDETHWRRLYQIFLTNIHYFGNGGIENIARVLRFLEDRYDNSKEDSGFVGFYLELLSRIMTSEFGGRSAPGFRSLEDYVVARISTVFSEQPIVSMNAGAKVLLALHEDKKIDACFRVSQSFLKSLALDQAAYTHIVDGSQLELDFKRILKRTIDCAQRLYVSESDTDSNNASLGNLAGGVAYLGNEDGEKLLLLRNFYRTYNLAEALFPRREDKGDWRQVYSYYDSIRSSKILEDGNP